ncbi:MAG: VTT domain-containing protein [Thaumarchaeota archaeon]|nr:VTT domain-containing protein [Nitrososphaerota archaeon]
MSDVPAFLLDFVTKYGYAGIFGVSLVGSVVPFVPIPYLLLVVLLSSTLNPLLLGLAAGFGGALGKVTSYALGWSGYRLSRGKTKRNLDVFRGFVGRYGDLWIFIFAVTPLPDDILFVPMGAVRFPFWRFIVADTAGKIVLSVAVAYAGSAYFGVAESFLHEGTALASVIIFILTLLLTYILAHIDWEQILLKYRERGFRGILSS